MEEMKTELEMQQETLCSLRKMAGMNRKEFSEEYGIPYRTIEDWEHGKRKMPEYVLRLLAYKVRIDTLQKEKENKKKEARNVQIITDTEGRKIVLINDIRFKSRRAICWNDIEEFVKEYIGQCYEIAESAEKIYIGTDFPDEFAHSNDTKGLKGANEKAKANISTVVEELIQIADNKREYPDYGKKHGTKAEYGWYRYDARFGIPVYDENEELERYNIFSTRMLVRCDVTGKLYLYDFVRTKKETSRPHEP